MSFASRTISNPASEHKLSGRNEPMLDSNREFNAGSKAELMRTLVHAMDEMSRGSFHDDFQKPTASQIRTAKEEARARVNAALNDPVEMQNLGVELAEMVKEADDRTGFMTQLMKFMPVENGVIPFIPFDRKVVTIGFAASPTHFYPQVMRGTFHMPQEVELKANVKVEMKQVHLRGEEVIQTAYDQSMEQISVGKDRLMKGSMDVLTGATHPLYSLSGRMTPDTIGEIKAYMEDFLVPATTMLVANSFWADIANWQSNNQINPFSSFEIFKTGRIANLYGLNFITDGYRRETLRVLDSNEFYLITDPDFFGCYTERGDIEVRATDGAAQGSSDKGWFMSTHVSATVVNSAGVIRGRRV